MTKKQITLAVLMLGTITTQAQVKPPIDHSVYDLWESIVSPTISKSGDYVFYTVSPQEGDSKTIIQHAKSKNANTIQRGINGKLNEAENIFISTIKPFYKETREAKIKKKKADEMPKDSLGILVLGEKTKFSNLGAIKSYKTAQNFKNYVAFIQELDVNAKKDNEKQDSVAKKTSKPKKEDVLILKNVSTGVVSEITKVDQYYFDRNEKFLVYNIKGPEKDSLHIAGLYLHDLNTKKTKKISNGKGNYKQITFDDQSKQLTFLADKSSEKSLIKDFKVYYYNETQDTARILIDKNTYNIPKEWYVSGDGSINFNANGTKFNFGIAPIPAVKDTTLVDFENAKVDIWHWQDDYLMPQQLVNLKRDQARSYDATYDIKESKLISLIDDSFNRISYTETANEEWALATSSTLAEKIASQWQYGQAQDVYIVSTKTGERRLIKNNWQGQVYLSPDATHVVLFDMENKQWIAYNIHNKVEYILTKNLNVSFVDEQNDMPAPASSYGISAWSSTNKGVYINDRYDIWYFSFDGKTQKNITNSYGRINNIKLRPIQAKTKEWRQSTFKIDEKSTILLSGFNEVSKKNGIYNLQLGNTAKLSQLIEDGVTFKSISSDAKGVNYIYTKENYQNTPNLYLSQNFVKEEKLSDINTQQNKYNWGTAELIKWKTPNGYDAEGILYKPENFDPSKKYPIIAYFYETLTEGLYTYHAPAPTPSRLMIPYFVSNEYLVFAPDIRYQDGHPGKSAEEYINSGMRFLAKNDWIDSTKMAIQGQSWGGYQVAHLITRTDMYAAAWTGAPVVNMTSAYGGIRWQTGMSRQFQYEKTQSRIGKTLWEDRDLYIENSPLFFLDKVNTPVAIMHNDNDGAVPWYQGIEMFTALRRLNKPVWMLNYNGDEHNLMQRQNRKDIQKRQAQFFDHFLKGKPAAEWIKSGVKAKNKGINWGFNTEN